MSAISIRKAVLADLRAILKIEQANASAAHWNASEYARLFEDSGIQRLALVAEAAKAVAGFVIAREVAVEWELENIAVAPDGQGQGIGAGLLQALVDRVREAGGTKLMLEVRESNLAARRLYERAGLEVCGRRKRYYQQPPEDALLFEKKLT